MVKTFLNQPSRCVIVYLFIYLFIVISLQSEYDRLRVITYPGTNVAIVCFSLVCPRSFTNVFDRWLPELVSYCPDTVAVVLVGLKADLRSSTMTRSSDDDLTTAATRLLPASDSCSADRRSEKRKYEPEVVTTAQGVKAARRIGADFYVECSALSGDRLAEVFSCAAAAALKSVAALNLSPVPHLLASWRRKHRRRVLERAAGKRPRSKLTIIELLVSLVDCWQHRTKLSGTSTSLHQ